MTLNLVTGLLALVVGSALLLVILIRRQNWPMILLSVLLGAAAFAFLALLESQIRAAPERYAELWQIRLAGFSLLFAAFFVALLVALAPTPILYRNVAIAIGMYLVIGVLGGVYYIVLKPLLRGEPLVYPRDIGFLLVFIVTWPYQLLTVTEAFGLRETVRTIQALYGAVTGEYG